MRTLGWVIACCALSAAGCRKSSGPAGPAPDDVVARVGDRSITVSTYLARMNEQAPVIRSRYTSLDKKKEFLDTLVRFELLSEEAHRRGLDKDPAVQAVMEKILVQELLRRRMDEVSKESNVPEEALKKYYQEHLAEFVRPERVRISTIVLATTRDDPKRAKVRAEATKLLAELKKAPAADPGPFAAAARAHSTDAPSQSQGGDVGYLTKEELASRFGPELAAAALSLKSIGEVAGPVETERGLHLIRLSGRQLGMNQSFDSVRSRIASRIAVEERSKSMDVFVAELRKNAKVKVNDDVLEKMNLAQEPAAQR